jgi:hypothetical protein
MSEPSEPGVLDQLFSASLEAAAQLISVDGEFYPFAVAMTAAGELVAPAVDPEVDTPTAERVVDLLVAALIDGRDAIVGAAIASDVTLAADGGGRDAIRVDLEAPDAEPVTVVVPYDAGPVLGDPMGMPGERRIFSA